MNLSISLQFLALEITQPLAVVIFWTHTDPTPVEAALLSWCSGVISVCQVAPGPFMNIPWLRFLGRLQSALTSRYLLEQLDLQPKSAWNILEYYVSSGDIWKRFSFFSENFSSCKYVILEKTAFFLLLHIILTFYQVTVFALF